MKLPALMASLAALSTLVSPGDARSAELRVLCANGMQAVMEALAPAYEQASANRLVVAYATGGATIKRVQAGEAVDVVIAPSGGIGSLVKGGRVSASAVTAIASTGISVAVRAGAPKPDISTPEALRRALLAARAITYLDPAEGGASGIHFAKVLDRLGIAGDMKAKTLFAPKTAAVGAFVAEGRADIGVIQHQLLFAVPGIEIAGPLPGDLQDTTVFSAAILPSTREIAASQSLSSYLRSTEAAAVITSKGLTPATP